MPLFEDLVKAPNDVVNHALDWTPAVPAGAASPIPTPVYSIDNGGDVMVTRISEDGLTSTVQLAGGTDQSYTVVRAELTLPDGELISRTFNVLVRKTL
jgi:hypothetical protein